MPRKKLRKSSKHASLKDLPVKSGQATHTRGGSLAPSATVVSPVVVAAVVPAETQTESRIFQSISNASKARQDITYNSIANMK